MLGERRSNSLFAPAAPAEPERKPEQAEVHDISFEERTGRSLFAEATTAPRASELFFAPQEKGVTFAEALSQVQGYLSETYATLITEDNSDAKEQMKRRMARYLQENRIAVDGMTASELVDTLYTEMAEYGFLTKYIFADGIEEIDINSWRDIEIQYSDGHTAKLEEHFDSPEHAANVIRRMLQNSGKVLDNASPIITSRLAKNIRISVIKTPVLDEDAGVAASIRIVNPRNLSKADFVQSGTATEEMLDFLSACLRRDPGDRSASPAADGGHQPGIHRPNLLEPAVQCRQIHPHRRQCACNAHPAGKPGAAAGGGHRLRHPSGPAGHGV